MYVLLNFRLNLSINNDRYFAKGCNNLKSYLNHLPRSEFPSFQTFLAWTGLLLPSDIIHASVAARRPN